MNKFILTSSGKGDSLSYQAISLIINKTIKLWFYTTGGKIICATSCKHYCIAI